MPVGTSVKGLQDLMVADPGVAYCNLILPQVSDSTVRRYGYIIFDAIVGTTAYQIQGRSIWTKANAIVLLPGFTAFSIRARVMWEIAGVDWDILMG